MNIETPKSPGKQADDENRPLAQSGKAWPALVLDASAPRVSVGIFSAPGVLLGRVELEGAIASAERLLPALDFLLRQTGLGSSDLARVVVGRGPGGFTGTRLALALAIALRLSRGLEVQGVSSLVGWVPATMPAGRPPASPGERDVAMPGPHCASTEGCSPGGAADTTQIAHGLGGERVALALYAGRLRVTLAEFRRERDALRLLGKMHVLPRAALRGWIEERSCDALAVDARLERDADVAGVVAHRPAAQVTVVQAPLLGPLLAQVEARLPNDPLVGEPTAVYASPPVLPEVLRSGHHRSEVPRGKRPCHAGRVL